MTLEDLAAEFGVSRERVRQIEVRAFEKVQTAVKNRIAAMEQPARNAGDLERGALTATTSKVRNGRACPGHFLICLTILTRPTRPTP